MSNRFHIVEGEDVVEYALKGAFNVILNSCNCFCATTKEPSKLFAKLFNTNKYPSEIKTYRDSYGVLHVPENLGNVNKLAGFEHQKFMIYSNLDYGISNRRLRVVNVYNQILPDAENEEKDEQKVNYDVLRVLFLKLNHRFKGMKICLTDESFLKSEEDRHLFAQTVYEMFTDCDVYLFRDFKLDSKKKYHYTIKNLDKEKE